MVTVRFKMEDGCGDLTPRKAHPDDAAFDVHSRIDITAEQGKVTVIPTGLFLELPPGYEAQIRPRSGLAMKQSLTVLNSPGTIDAGYRGEVAVLLFNAGTKPYDVHRGDRIAQMVVQQLPEVELVSADTLSDTARGNGGFGSTGIERKQE